MRDPIVEEVRQRREDHARQFQGDLHLICEDLRKLEASLQDRLITPTPRRTAAALKATADRQPGLQNFS